MKINDFFSHAISGKVLNEKITLFKSKKNDEYYVKITDLATILGYKSERDDNASTSLLKNIKRVANDTLSLKLLDISINHVGCRAYFYPVSNIKNLLPNISTAKIKNLLFTIDGQGITTNAKVINNRTSSKRNRTDVTRA